MYNRRYSLRFIALFSSFFIFFLFFSIRLILIQIFNSEYLSKLADQQHSRVIQLHPDRGKILDRKMRPLAVNVPSYSLYASPRTMNEADKQRALTKLPKIITINEATLRNRLDQDKKFIWLARKLSFEQMTAVQKESFQGLYFIKESKRDYPSQFLASHLVGFAGIDNSGLEGLELYYNDILKGRPGSTQVIRDARQRDLLIERQVFLPQHGFDLILTIDQNIQYIAEQAIEKAFVKHQAKGASLVILDPKTGEVLALVNRPTYNLSEFQKSSQDQRRNRAITDMYEPGSIFKIVTAAAALEEQLVFESDKFFCEHGRYRIANHVLTDHRPHGDLTFREVMEQSSNIGIVKVAQLLGPALVYQYASRFRFGQRTGIDLPGEVSGVLRSVSRWSKTSIGAVPIGHEVGVTVLQMASAMAAIANRGIYMKPYVVKKIKDQTGETINAFDPEPLIQVISEGTARRLSDILVGAVENGTGRMARIPGVNVAGKTGTARKVIDGAYSRRHFYASFIGFAPAEDPLIVIAVMLDDPRPQYFGGTVCAPVFKEVAEHVLKYLQGDSGINP